MNKMYIEVLKSGIQPLEFLLQEDFTVEAKSEFGTFGDLIPGVFRQLIDLATAFNATGDKLGKGVVYMNNVLDLKRWTKTPPPVIQCTLKFYTKEDVIEDVWLPMNLFVSLGILTRDKSGNFVNPAPSLNSVGKISTLLSGKSNPPKDIKGNTVIGTKDYVKQSLKEKILKNGFVDSFSTIQSKIVSVWIPGIIYIPFAFVENCQPRYSNQVVIDNETGMEYPLFGELQLSISGISSAIDDFFLDSNRVRVDTTGIIPSSIDSYKKNTTSDFNKLKEEAEKEQEASGKEPKDIAG